jgi:hypothetical protein
MNRASKLLGSAITFVSSLLVSSAQSCKLRDSAKQSVFVPQLKHEWSHVSQLLYPVKVDWSNPSKN